MTTTPSQATLELPTGSWKLDEGLTKVTVSAKKLGFFTIPGTLNVEESRIDVDENNQITGVEVVVDAASYDTGNAKRDTHVRSADFLDADAHPTLAFRTGAVVPTNRGYEAEGTLTAKGETAPIAVEIRNVEIDAETGTASFAASAMVDRGSIGINKMPSFFIGPDLELVVSATVSKSGA